MRLQDAITALALLVVDCIEGFCPSVGWTDHHASGICYRLILTPVNFTEAQSSCDLIEGTLVLAKTNNESHQLLPIIINGSIWSQYKLVVNNGTTIVQDSDSATISDCVECSNLIGSIGNQSFTSICLVINFNSTHFNWAPVSCSDKYSYLCEYKSAASGLRGADVAAILIAALILLSFIIVVVADLYIERNRPIDSRLLAHVH